MAEAQYAPNHTIDPETGFIDIVNEISNTAVKMDEKGQANRWSAASVASNPILMKADIDYLVRVIRGFK